jgi:hypothetical protein
MTEGTLTEGTQTDDTLIDGMDLEYRAHDILWYRRVEDGKVRYLLVPASVRQLEDQVGEPWN